MWLSGLGGFKFFQSYLGHVIFCETCPSTIGFINLVKNLLKRSKNVEGIGLLEGVFLFQAFGYLWLECDRWEKVLTLGKPLSAQ